MQHSIAQVYTSVGIDITTRDTIVGGTELFAYEIKNKFSGLGKKYIAKVTEPIQKQNPVAKQFDENYKKFEFSDKTFKLEGQGSVQYSARLANDQPLPSWIDFLPTQRAFLIDSVLKGDIHEIDLIVNAKNINSTVEDQFTLIVDPILKSKKDLAKIVGTTLKEKAEIVTDSEIQ